MKDDNQVKSNSMIFEYLGIISFVVTTFVCALSYLIFKILFTEQYLSGYIVAPYLFLAPLLWMLFQVAANQFIVVKKTWPNMLILSTGAIVNIVINFIFIPGLGIEGAAIATLKGYMISDIVCVIVLCKMKLMVIDLRFILASVGMLLYILIWRVFSSSNYCISTMFSVCFSIYLFILYKKDINTLILKIKRRKFKNE